MSKERQLELYNPDRKTKFLEEEYPNEKTATTYKSLLSRASIFENEKDKDLCDFNYQEAVELLIGLRKKTWQSLSVAHSVISRYVDWCIDIKQSYSKTGINSFKLITPEEKQKYVHQVALKKSYFTREEIFSEVIDQLYNYVDKAIVALLFETVRGRVEFEELRNLRRDDEEIFAELNQIRVTRTVDGKKQSRILEVSKETMDILLKAAVEDEYYKKNGEADNQLSVLPLKDNDYLIRTIDYDTFNSDERATVNSIVTRIRKIRQYTGIKFLTANLIFYSGLLEKCHKIEEVKGELSTQDYKDIYLNMGLSDNQYPALKSKYELFKKNKSSK